MLDIKLTERRSGSPRQSARRPTRRARPGGGCSRTRRSGAMLRAAPARTRPRGSHEASSTLGRSRRDRPSSATDTTQPSAVRAILEVPVEETPHTTHPTAGRDVIGDVTRDNAGWTEYVTSRCLPGRCTPCAPRFEGVKGRAGREKGVSHRSTTVTPVRSCHPRNWAVTWPHSP